MFHGSISVSYYTKDRLPFLFMKKRNNERVLFQNGIITNATTSIRSPIKNLTEINSAIKMDKLITAIGKEYLRTNAHVLEDEESNSFQGQTEFQFINPTESYFPGRKIKMTFV